MSDPNPPAEAVQPDAVADQFLCELRVEGRDAAWILTRGELDLGSSRRFERTLEDALRAAKLIIVDLRELTFMDSTGVSAIIEADARARGDDRRLVLVRGPAQVQRLLTLVGIADRLEIVELTNGQAPASALATPPASEAAP